jgi:hypothetical protein
MNDPAIKAEVYPLVLNDIIRKLEQFADPSQT